MFELESDVGNYLKYKKIQSSLTICKMLIEEETLVTMT